MFSKYLPKRVAIAKRAPATDAEAVELAKLDALLAKMDEEGDEDEDELDAPVTKRTVTKKAPMAEEDEDGSDDGMDELESMLGEDDEDEAPVKKSARAPITKREVQLMKRLEQLEKREKQRTLLTKAVQLVGDAPVDAEEVVKVLNAVVGDKEALAAFGSIMKRFSALTEASGVFTSVGSSEEEGEAATTELTKAAVQLRKKDPKLSAQQAIAKALEMHPELYEAYIGGEVSDDDLVMAGEIGDTDGEE